MPQLVTKAVPWKLFGLSDWGQRWCTPSLSHWRAGTAFLRTSKDCCINTFRCCRHLACMSLKRLSRPDATQGTNDIHLTSCLKCPCAFREGPMRSTICILDAMRPNFRTQKLIPKSGPKSRHQVLRMLILFLITNRKVVSKNGNQNRDHNFGKKILFD